jgi:D-alanyl-D-alanine carboxypeptidase/D-alanyl-D-alanine-endopeptidase (penicillin-binding protein 4)
VIRAIALAFVVLPFATSVRAEPPYQELARRVVGAGQGVYVVAEDGTVLASEAAERAVHPASVTKVATSLALLSKLGPAHRFTTTLVGAGGVDAGVLRGNLVVEATGDPFLVDEGAFLILRRLHAIGLRTVDGRIAVHGRLLFDWGPDPAGTAFARSLAGKSGTWPSGSGWPPLRDAALTFHGPGAAHARPAKPVPVRGTATNAGDRTTPLVVYRSPPLLAILKALNGYSNNVFHLASDAIGGPPAVEAIARAAVPAELRDQIRIANGAGAGTENRISPRAAVALVGALRHELAGLDRELSDVLPVSGIDPGTLHERLLAPPAGRGILVGKTGTYGSEGASALAGVLRTKRFGVVTFAVLNAGLAVPEARTRQDAFVGELATALGAEPWPYTTPAAPAFDQAEVQ